jgi:hypothetical protein
VRAIIVGVMLCFESSGGGNTPRLWLIGVEVSAVGEGDRSCPF